MNTFVDIHTHNPLKVNLGIVNFRLGVDKNPPQKPFSAGIHPWDTDVTKGNLATLLDQLRTINCVAIGEIGLDRACKCSWKAQLELLEAQLRIAENRGLPIILHCVRAQAEILSLLSHFSTIPAVIFHGFIGSPEQLQELVSRGYHISFGFSALKSPKTIRTIGICPADNLLLESDASSEDIATLYSAIAEIRGISIEQLSEQISSNYKRIFQ